MSLLTESAFAAIQDLLSEQSFGSIDEVNEYLRQCAGVPVSELATRVPQSPSRRAQSLLARAEQTEGSERFDLARQALEIDPACSDAILILAGEAETLESVREICERAVATAKASLTSDMFEDPQYVGEFWRMLETRPYMRALEALAEACHELGELQAAIDHARQLLRLNPNDNQGVRYSFVAWLIEAGLDREAADLIHSYREDGSSFFRYAKALLLFRKEGLTANSVRAMQSALVANPFVLSVLTSNEEFKTPGYYGFGDKNEAIMIVQSQAIAWSGTPGSDRLILEGASRIAYGKGIASPKPLVRSKSKAKSKKKRR